MTKSKKLGKRIQRKIFGTKKDIKFITPNTKIPKRIKNKIIRKRKLQSFKAFK